MQFLDVLGVFNQFQVIINVRPFLSPSVAACWKRVFIDSSVPLYIQPSGDNGWEIEADVPV